LITARRGAAFASVGAALAVATTLIAGAAGAEGTSAARHAPSCKGERATIVGTNGADVLRGTKRADVIIGRGGNDQIDGRGSKDLICAGNDPDFVDGGEASDRIYGEGADDILLGDEASDKLFGNNGDDAMDGQDGKRDLCSGASGDDLAADRGCEKIRGARPV
jgi:Ca2+-binding RTX toxin-like protein